MNKPLTMAAGLLTGSMLLLAAAPAMARVDVDLNIGVPGYYAPAPTYYEPRPVYVQPAPVYVAPRPVYYEQERYYGRHRHWEERHWRGRGHDRDRDGVPNRYDRDRDGDGVPNRYDYRPDNPRRH